MTILLFSKDNILDCLDDKFQAKINMLIFAWIVSYTQSKICHNLIRI